jgi:hypothetical protein
MSANNDQSQGGRPVQNEPDPKANKGTGFVWLVVCGGILTVGFLTFNGGMRPAEPVPVLARRAPEPRPATPVPVPVTVSNPAPADLVVWPALRVQAIFFSAARSSAMINGQTFFVNDSIGELRIAAIATNSVTLLNHGETRVLKLGQ